VVFTKLTRLFFQKAAGYAEKGERAKDHIGIGLETAL